MRKKLSLEYLRLLEGWVKSAVKDIYSCPDRPDLLYYGDGTNGWGTQTNQKCFAAIAVLACAEDLDETNVGVSRNKLYELALGMLRYSLESHKSGSYHTTDADDFKWGHTWISSLGVERMMHAVLVIYDKLTDHDKEMLRNMLISESDWLLDEYEVKAGLVDNNKPESNMWNGSVLYRTAMMYPDAERAEKYIEKAKIFFANSISTPTDEFSQEIIDGKPMSEYFIGANFEENMSCDHHRYMNVGYMVITLSNLAMLHFTLKHMGAKAPELLYHNFDRLWQLVRMCMFSDGRLNRIGGDSRVRYCYCQDYLIPVLVLAADCGLATIDELNIWEESWLKLVEKEVKHNGDGSFLSDRCELLVEKSPLYYTRLESDRAVGLSYGLLWNSIFDFEKPAEIPYKINKKYLEPIKSWDDQYHGSCYVVGENRLASFTWRSSEFPMGLCTPPEDSSIAEWKYNMTSVICGDGFTDPRELRDFRYHTFDGGFSTCGVYAANTEGLISEQLNAENTAIVNIAYAALPDDATVITLQYAYTTKHVHIAKVKGLKLNIPNDVFNDFKRDYFLSDEKRYVTVDNRLLVSSIYGGEIDVYQPEGRQITIKNKCPYPTRGMLHCDEITTKLQLTPKWYEKGDTVLDFAASVMCMPRGTDCVAIALEAEKADITGELTRAVTVRGADGNKYLVAANFSEEAVECTAVGIALSLEPHDCVVVKL